MLITIGKMLVSLAAAALAVGLLALIPAFAPIAGPPGLSLGASAALLGAGIGMILLGRVLGGGGSAATSESSTSASNSANSSTGAQSNTKAEYDPNKDPQLMYQKQSLTTVLLDIRVDDGIIIKKIIKATNRDSRLGNLIGNANTGFR